MYFIQDGAASEGGLPHTWPCTEAALHLGITPLTADEASKGRKVY